jgi:hypothetical protein
MLTFIVLRYLQTRKTNRNTSTFKGKQVCRTELDGQKDARLPPSRLGIVRAGHGSALGLSAVELRSVRL